MRCEVFAQRAELCRLQVSPDFSLTKLVLETYFIWSAGNSFPKLLLTAYERHVDAVTRRPE